MSKILVVPPAYNENVKLKHAIERFLKSPLAGKVDYLIVDDCSTDGTTEMIKSFADRGVRTVRHETRSGVGAAIRTAIKYARANGYEVIVIMAGNDKDNPDEIPALLQPVLKDGCEFVQGSRYKGKVGTGGDMPFYRKIATRLHPLLMSLFTGRRVTDSTNGFRAMRLSLFDDERINLDQPWLDTYELEPYIMFKALRLGHKCTEVFVTKIYPPKKLGYTKMQPFVGWWSILKPIFYLGLGIKK
ncbi:MAG: glycosyltransferase family 2 protein [Candidatus Omnitrophica bacterium]|nr:glycosyltransferase family 2 protein [Candidatus Omnitrophota bacterium]